MHRVSWAGIAGLAGVYVGARYHTHVTAAKNAALQHARSTLGMRAPRKDPDTILAHTKQVMHEAKFAVLCTCLADDQARSSGGSKPKPCCRLIQPFEPTETLCIHFNTTRSSRKFAQLCKNNEAALTYTLPSSGAYVTLRGEVFMLKHTEAQGFWKEYMRLYYPDGFTDDFTVWKFVPHTIEVVDLSRGFVSTRKDWKAPTLRRSCEGLPWFVDCTGEEDFAGMN